MKDLSKMKVISSPDTVLLSLNDSPAQPASSVLAQNWCQQQLGKKKRIQVWFLQNAVYHALQPETDAGRPADIYSGWKALADNGVKLFICRAACRRRLPAGSIDTTVFSPAGLTGWADQILKQQRNGQNEVTCIIDNDPGQSRFLNESIDPVHAFLALEARVTVIFTVRARWHLLDTGSWRKWRMLPETEDQVQLLVINTDLEPEQQQILSSRSTVTGITTTEFQQICLRGNVIYV